MAGSNNGAPSARGPGSPGLPVAATRRPRLCDNACDQGVIGIVRRYARGEVPRDACVRGIQPLGQQLRRVGEMLLALGVARCLRLRQDVFNHAKRTSRIEPHGRTERVVQILALETLPLLRFDVQS